MRTPIGLLPTDEFYWPIALLRHIKDVLIGQEHGEFTHLLQWYIILRAAQRSATP